VPGTTPDQTIGTDLEGRARPARNLSPGAYQP
jgi:hypothetical protein